MVRIIKCVLIISAQTWRMVIMHPLPSDYNHNEIDPKEGGRAHQLAIEVDKIHGTHQIPDPYSIVVTAEFDTILRMLHVLIHFEDYMYNFIVIDIDLDDLKPDRFADVWVNLFKEHAKVPIDKLTRETKTSPKIVSNTSKLRDFLKIVMKK